MCWGENCKQDTPSFGQVTTRSFSFVYLVPFKIFIYDGLVIQWKNQDCKKFGRILIIDSSCFDGLSFQRKQKGEEEFQGF